MRILMTEPARPPAPQRDRTVTSSPSHRTHHTPKRSKMSVVRTLRKEFYRDRGSSDGGTQISTSPTSVSKVVDILGLTKKDIFVDVGSGTGRFVGASSTQAKHAYGFEVDPDMVEISKNNLKRASWDRNTTIYNQDVHSLEAFPSDTTVVVAMNAGFPPSLQIKLMDLVLSSKRTVRRFCFTFGKLNQESPLRDCFQPIKHFAEHVAVTCGNSHTLSIFDTTLPWFWNLLELYMQGAKEIDPLHHTIATKAWWKLSSVEVCQRPAKRRRIPRRYHKYIHLTPEQQRNEEEKQRKALKKRRRSPLSIIKI